MKPFALWFFLGFYSFLTAQQQYVRGKITNQYDEALFSIEVIFDGSSQGTTTNKQGYFELALPKNVKHGDLLFKRDSLQQQRIPIRFNGSQDINLGTWIFISSSNQKDPMAVFNLQDLDLDIAALDRDQIGSFLYARRDAFLNSAAFQFGTTFFRLRGLNNSHQEVRLNGIRMNSFYSGAPQWSQWGGLNDFTNRGQHYYYGVTAESKGFGGILATSEINLRPSNFRSGAKFSQAFSNASYRFRSMASYIQPPTEKTPGYAFLFSKRSGEKGYLEGTFYDAWSAALLLEHSWNDKHHSWFTALFTPNRRGKSAPLTEEVYQLKGRYYNPYWGWQNGKQRSARESRLATPILILNHRWQLRKNTYWQLNIGHSWGEQAGSRLRYNGHQRLGNFLQGGGYNPDPVYYQQLPSYALRNQNDPDYARAFLMEHQLLKAGQIQWESLYKANKARPNLGVYALYDEVQKVQHWSVTLQTKYPITSRLTSQWEGYFSRERSHFFARPKDLLGASQLWDIDPYAASVEASPNNLLDPETPVKVGDPFMYNYALFSQAFGATTTFEYQGAGWTTFAGLQFHQQQYLREGYFKNGSFPKASYGPGKTQTFTTWSLKSGVNYALTGRHRLFLFAALKNRPPAFRHVYLNPRAQQDPVPNSQAEQGIHANIGYQWQAPSLDLKVNFYGLQRKNIQEVAFYFADGVGGDHALFVQEVLTNMTHQHFGAEVSFVYQPIPELKLIGVAALGQFRYANNPHLILSTAPTLAAQDAGFKEGIKDFGKAYLNRYSLAGGPQRAFSLSVNYNDPNYWRLSVYGNYFSNAYLDPNPLTRTKNMYTDIDGLPFANYDPLIANDLLKQEQFPGYFLMNLTAGKSWLAGGHYFGFFISLQNLLNAHFKTGGYEQGRNANYQSLLEDSQRNRPLFGPKYWWGRGTTYFATFYFSF